MVNGAWPGPYILVMYAMILCRSWWGSLSDSQAHKPLHKWAWGHD